MGVYEIRQTVGEFFRKIFTSKYKTKYEELLNNYNELNNQLGEERRKLGFNAGLDEQRTSRISILERQLDVMGGTVSVGNKNVQELSDKVSLLESEKAALNRGISEITESLANQGAQIAGLRADLIKKDAEVVSYQAQGEEYLRRISEIEQKHAREVRDYEKTKKDRGMLINYLKKKIAELRDEHVEESARNYILLHPGELVIATNKRDLIGVVSLPRKMARRLGYNTEELVGRNVYSLIENPEKHKEFLKSEITAYKASVRNKEQGTEELSLRSTLQNVVIRGINDGKNYKTNLVVLTFFKEGAYGNKETIEYERSMIREETWSEGRSRRKTEKRINREDKKASDKVVEESQKKVDERLARIEGKELAEQSLPELGT